MQQTGSGRLESVPERMLCVTDHSTLSHPPLSEFRLNRGGRKQNKKHVTIRVGVLVDEGKKPHTYPPTHTHTLIFQSMW